MRNSHHIFAYVRGMVDSVASTDVKVCDYLTDFFSSVFVLGYFDHKSSTIIKRATPVIIPVKPLKIPFIQGFVISILALVSIIRLKPHIVLWNWLYFFPGGLFVKFLYPRIKMYIDIRSHPITEKSRFKTAFYDALFTWILRYGEKVVDGITIISPSMYIYISKRYGIKLHKKICIWSSGFDKDLFEYINEHGHRYLDRLRQTLGVKETDKVMLYYGSIAYSRLPLFRLLVETMALLEKDQRKVTLLIVGKGDAVEELRKLIRFYGLEGRIILVSPVSHNLIPLILMISDIVIAPFPRDLNWLTQVPLKVIEAVGMRRAILTTPLMELRHILPEEYLIDYEDLSPENLKNKIEMILYGRSKRDHLNDKLVLKFSWREIAKMLYNCVER